MEKESKNFTLFPVGADLWRVERKLTGTLIEINGETEIPVIGFSPEREILYVLDRERGEDPLPDDVGEEVIREWKIGNLGKPKLVDTYEGFSMRGLMEELGVFEEEEA